MQAVIRFLRAEWKSAVDIRCHLCVVYGGNVMLACTVCEWVHHFHNEKRTNIHDKAREGRPHDECLVQKPGGTLICISSLSRKNLLCVKLCVYHFIALMGR